jgi:hypothetical protein
MKPKILIKIELPAYNQEDCFLITMKDGSYCCGYTANRDFPDEKKVNTRGEIFSIYVEDPRKGTGTKLAMEALNLMKKYGSSTVKMNVPGKQGKPFIDSLEKKGFISFIKKAKRTTSAEYKILI